MNTPQFVPAGLRKAEWWEHALRFVFGGLVTVAAGLAGHRWGPIVGGLFLAFPSILPASLTLVKRHDGRAQAVDDARGARIGAVAIAAFGLVVFALARTAGVLVVAAAAAAWAVVAVGGWFIVHGRSR